MAPGIERRCVKITVQTPCLVISSRKRDPFFAIMEPTNKGGRNNDGYEYQSGKLSKRGHAVGPPRAARLLGAVVRALPHGGPHRRGDRPGVRRHQGRQDQRRRTAGAGERFRRDEHPHARGDEKRQDRRSGDGRAPPRPPYSPCCKGEARWASSRVSGGIPKARRKAPNFHLRLQFLPIHDILLYMANAKEARRSGDRGGKPWRGWKT